MEKREVAVVPARGGIRLKGALYEQSFNAGEGTYQEDRNGRFLVLPKGMVTEPGWSFGEGKLKKNAVRLVQETR